MQRIYSWLQKPQLARFTRRLSSEAEIENKYFLKRSLDNTSVELMKKHENNILYSSYVENNKRPLSYQHRLVLRGKCDREIRRKLYEAETRKPFSLALKYASASLEESQERKQAPKAKDRPQTLEELKLDNERDTSRNIIMNEQKLIILRELSRRQQELEHQEQKYPEKWMQDYETFDETDEDNLVADSHFGTPGTSDLERKRCIYLTVIFFQIQKFRFPKCHAMVAEPRCSAPTHLCRDICPAN